MRSSKRRDKIKKERASAAKNSSKGKSRQLGTIGLFVLAAFLSAGILALEPWQGVGGHEFQIGEPAPRTLFSPFEIHYEDALKTEAFREQKRREWIPVFMTDPTALQKATEEVAHFFRLLTETQKEVIPPEQKIVPVFPFTLSENSLKVFYSETDLEPLRENLQLLLEQTFLQKIVSRKVLETLQQQNKKTVLILSPDGSALLPVDLSDVLVLEDVQDYAEDYVPQKISQNKNVKKAVAEVFRLVLRENFKENVEENKLRLKKALDAIVPVQGVIKKDELVIQRGILISSGDYQKIQQIQKKLKNQKTLNRFAGIAMIVLLTFLLCTVYLYFFDRKMFLSRRRMLLFQASILITLVICKAVAVWPSSSLYLMPTALAPLVLVLLVPMRMGILCAVMMAVFSGPLSGFQPDIMIATLISGIAGSFAAVNVRKRLDFLRVGILIGACYFSVLCAFRIYHEYGIHESVQLSILGFANGLFMTIPICFLLVPLLEWLFNLLTDITLLELSDLNHPLLKRMIVEAPGTYHHSLVVSTLAESACQAIGANALLARVGCYFHDIGKIARAEYFTENQRTKLIENRHDYLAPGLSTVMIMNHVRDGIELGRQHKLKNQILNFIPEHHGTGVVYYFYRRALDHALPGEEVNPNNFRYPGPKPQSRETAIALLADSTEAASRSIAQPTPESVRQLVRKIINDKFVDGQLDECDLTLRDLYHIQESFVQNLMAILHTRVAYPTAEEKPDMPKLFDQDQVSKFRTEHHEE